MLNYDLKSYVSFLFCLCIAIDRVGRWCVSGIRKGRVYSNGGAPGSDEKIPIDYMIYDCTVGYVRSGGRVLQHTVSRLEIYEIL